MAVLLPSILAQMNPDGRTWHSPAPHVNNSWFARNPSSDVVFVFVHGLNSDSRCWIYEENGSEKQYWPYLVWADERLDRPSVFLGGYAFGDNYTIFDAVKELRHSLREKGVLDRKNIIFVAHSMGGIVVRRMLINNADNFRSKKIGLLLYASPTGGSELADQAFPLLKFLKLPQTSTADLLATSSRYLIELDQEFADLIDGSSHGVADRLNITGVSVVEGEASVLGTQVVGRASASRYFSYEAIQADHFSIVKPESTSNRSHQILADFYSRFMEEPFQTVVGPAIQTTSNDPNDAKRQERTSAEAPRNPEPPQSGGSGLAPYQPDRRIATQVPQQPPIPRALPSASAALPTHPRALTSRHETNAFEL